MGGVSKGASGVAIDGFPSPVMTGYCDRSPCSVDATVRGDIRKFPLNKLTPYSLLSH